MNIEQIQAELESLVALMVEKGVPEPEAHITFRDSGRLSVYIRGSYKNKLFDGGSSKFIHADDAQDACTKARSFIGAMPSPEETVTREYLGKVAAAIDYATENAIDDEYVAPLRGVSCAMTDNLLTGPTKEGK